MLIGKKSSFSVTFGFCSHKKFGLEIVPEDEWRELDEEDRSHYEEVTVTFRPLTFGMNNRLRAQAEFTDATTNMRALNWEQYQENKLCRAIIAWTMEEQGPEGDPVPCEPSDENIRRLHPEMAKYLLDVYAEETELSEEAEGN